MLLIFMVLRAMLPATEIIVVLGIKNRATIESFQMINGIFGIFSNLKIS